MNKVEREKRDAKIMEAWRGDVAPLDIARRWRLTLNRVMQIIERETKCASSSVHAAKDASA
jgi:hypothetical protein